MSKYRKYILLSIGIILLPLILISHDMLAGGSYRTGNLMGHIGLLLFGIFLLYRNLRKEKRWKDRK